MTSWFYILILVYAVALIYCTIKARQATKGSRQEFLTAGPGLGAFLGFLTFAATLFSTFTLMGMPDFFRTHGVGGWIFLGVTDVAMALLILWFGLKLRRHLAGRGFESVSSLLSRAFGTRFAGAVYLAGIFVFLVPYVSIQIRGVATFLATVAPVNADMWVWALGMLVFMLIYSGIGGLRAIIYSDVVQGLVLLAVTWFIAYGCVKYFGGVGEMFQAVADVDRSLLSTPGPNGLFTPQFLVASFLAIIVMPISQPQLTIRLAIMRSDSELRRMAAAVAVFAFLVIVPTVAIGAYGAVVHAGMPTAEFLGNALVLEQPGFIGAAAIVGLLAAAMSTADSQLFALGSECENFLPGDPKYSLIRAKAAILVFAVASFVMALLSSDQLVLLARVSFAGTSLLAPMILAAVLCKKRLGLEIPVIAGLALIVFVLSLAGVIPVAIGPWRLDLALLVIVSTATLLSIVLRVLKGHSAL